MVRQLVGMRMKRLIIMFLSVMVSTTDFDSVSLGSSPKGTTH
jgi:hypothetical protein